MPWAMNDGVRLHYEVAGEGPPLVLHVGFMGSLEDWRLPGTSYVDALKRTHRLILLDPRGQGQSDKPRDSLAYAMAQRTGDVIAVLDDLGIDRAVFWGYSLGGRVAFELAARYPERLSGMVAGGANLYRRIDVDTDPLLAQLREGMPVVVREWERGFGPMPGPMRERWLKNDNEAMVAAWRAPGQPSSVVGNLGDLATRSLLYVGGADHMRDDVARPAESMPDAGLVVIDRLNHMETFYRQDRVLPHVQDFLDRT